MDSLTQAALGAAVAEAGLGRTGIGNKAILWGVALGTLPDLDVLLYPWLDSVDRLYWHRGLSHSLLFMLAAAPILGLLIRRIHRPSVGLLRATLTVFAILLTHVLIDVFTVYGTSVLAPFSDLRLGWNNLFIIDPLYTLPLLLGLVVAWFSRPGSNWRARANRLGLGLSSLYVVWSFAAKSQADRHFAAALAEQKIPFSQWMSSPTPFNTVLWRCLAANEDSLWIGYYSLNDPPGHIQFDRLPRNRHLLQGLEESRSVRALRWFTGDFYGVSERDGQVVFSDWRFGEIRPHFGPLSESETIAPIFAWSLHPQGGDWALVARRPELSRGAMLPLLWNRLTAPPARLVFATGTEN